MRRVLAAVAILLGVLLIAVAVVAIAVGVAMTLGGVVALRRR